MHAENRAGFEMSPTWKLASQPANCPKCWRRTETPRQGRMVHARCRPPAPSPWPQGSWPTCVPGRPGEDPPGALHTVAWVSAANSLPGEPPAYGTAASQAVCTHRLEAPLYFLVRKPPSPVPPGGPYMVYATPCALQTPLELQAGPKLL